MAVLDESPQKRQCDNLVDTPQKKMKFGCVVLDSKLTNEEKLEEFMNGQADSNWTASLSELELALSPQDVMMFIVPAVISAFNTEWGAGTGYYNIATVVWTGRLVSSLGCEDRC